LATGTHGTGLELQNLSASLVGARIVAADGAIIECDEDLRPDLLECARLSLGALGVVTEVTLRVREAYKLEERIWLEDLDAVLERIDEHSAASRHFEFFWLPGGTRAACKTLAETDADPVYPLAAEGKRLAWSYEVLANDRPDKHTEMEYSVPRQSGADCLRALREMIARDFPDLAWPLEYRNLAADEVWLSTAYRRPSVTISVHQGIDQPDEPLFRACEAIFLQHEGRPHWGKVHYLCGAEMARLHPRWEEWWRMRESFDPNGLFLNDHLDGLRPGR
jgi:FAD/FMN-containing dehydrogenase